MGFKVFLVAASIALSALLSTQDSFAKNSQGDEPVRVEQSKKVDIFQ